MKKLLFIIIILLVVTPVYAEDNNQQELINKGFDFIKLGNYQKAVEAFEIAVRINKNNADAYFGLGISFFKLGNNETMTIPSVVEEAISVFRKALRLGVNYPEIYYNLGLCYLAVHNKEEAVEEYNILKDFDNGLADQLFTEVSAYQSLPQYTKVYEIVYSLPMGERKSVETQESVTGLRPQNRIADADQSSRLEKCKKEADNIISSPSGTTTMSATQRNRAEADYEQRKIDYIKSCMGYPNPTVVIDREAEERANKAERRARMAESEADSAEQKARNTEHRAKEAEMEADQAEQKARDAEHRSRNFYDIESSKWFHCSGRFCY